MLSEQVHIAAFGTPGEPGDVSRILHMADRYVAIYESFIDWAARLRSHATRSDEAHELFRAVALHAQQPVERMRSFAYEFRDIAEVTPEASTQFDHALRNFERAIRTAGSTS